MVLIITVYHMIAFSELLHDVSVDLRMAIGLSFIIAVIGIMIPCNIAVMIYNLVRDIWVKRLLI
jgi:hypothetical protein